MHINISITKVMIMMIAIAVPQKAIFKISFIRANSRVRDTWVTITFIQESRKSMGIKPT
jgi:hypothetical protein